MSDPTPTSPDTPAAPPTADEIYRRICALIEPFNKKGVAVTPQTTFAGDLDLDSLNVMDLVAAIEDEFDIILPINRLPDLETVQQVADEVASILKG
ncbi:acyl carrier protein [Rhodothalassium salexigens DSM 2132]|uniref:Acyl carrier protein n=1 Tax=Rhodothalassium salexigens DSM 2132 TaxID=1188247 RepID=A0A4R2PU24_RHOSA|nr:acyl carrier protein [Rhodothalassium salexigens]MBB4210820.1 acyl carrier protein [Rhodothalassium salexigens DSM 2132]MBK1639419.1 hypothetical protein [Rhodothalassium salexigens DSM 2132]TCP37625.1 acyl carrier protein [Rhodothalassium salexigens DSM 2132]